MPFSKRFHAPGPGMYLLVASVFLLVAACGEPDATPTATASPTSESSTGNVEPGDGELAFPRQQPAVGHNDAGLPGRLVERNGCLWMEPEHSEDLTLVIWWHDFDYAINDETIQILNGDGQQVAEVGDNIVLGGSGTDSWDRSDELPEACQSGPFWYASPDIVNVDEREANAVEPPADYFTYQTQREDVADARKIAATVTFSQGCLTIRPSTEKRQYQAVWPDGTRLESNYEEIDIFLPDSGPFTTGKHRGYVMRGFAAADVEELENQVNMIDRGPDSCPDVYWIVESIGSDDPIEVDSAMYAVDYGISLDEAVERLENQSGESGDALAELSQALETNERDTFAGLWYQHEPEYRIVVAFTENGEQTIEPYLEGFGPRDLIEVRQVEYTLQELRDAQAQAHDIVEQFDLGMQISSGTNIIENRTEVYVPDKAAFDAVLNDAGVTLPEPVLVVEVD